MRYKAEGCHVLDTVEDRVVAYCSSEQDATRFADLLNALLAEAK